MFPGMAECFCVCGLCGNRSIGGDAPGVSLPQRMTGGTVPPPSEGSRTEICLGRQLSTIRLQQVTAPSAFASSESSMSCTITSRARRRSRVRGNATG